VSSAVTYKLLNAYFAPNHGEVKSIQAMHIKPAESVFNRAVKSCLFDASHFDSHLLSAYLSFMKETIAEKLSGSQGMAQERFFWERLFHERKLKRGEVFQDTRSSIGYNLIWAVTNDLRRKFGEKLQLLDVGSGPFSKLIAAGNAEHADVVCVDPLANFYSSLHKKYSTQYNARLVAGYGEELHRKFTAGHFHLAFTQNSLDHSTNPQQFVRSMFEVVKSGGHLVFVGYNRTGSAERWTGPHQWDIEVEGDQLLLTNKTQTIHKKSLTGALGMTLAHKTVAAEHVGRYYLDYVKN
jgi:ubiquinone/menaquinone biosynthesis C-methylase UbiE